MDTPFPRTRRPRAILRGRRGTPSTHTPGSGLDRLAPNAIARGRGSPGAAWAASLAPGLNRRKEVEMRWAATLKGASFVLAGAVGLAPAQTPRSMTDGVPCSSWVCCTPYSPTPPCATPTHPHVPGTIVVPPGAASPPPGGLTTPTPPSPGQLGAAATTPGALAAAAADPAAGGGGERGSDALASAAPNMYGDDFGGPPLRVVIARPPIVIPATPGLPAIS